MKTLSRYKYPALLGLAGLISVAVFSLYQTPAMVDYFWLGLPLYCF